jgi:hypothetical protein
MFGDPVMTFTFLPYSDTVASQYGVPSLCALVYTLTLALDATNFGVTVDTPSLTLSALPVNYLLIGSQKTLSLKADSSTLQQTAASQTVSFKIIVTDPCPSTVIELSFLTFADLTYVAAEPTLVQTFALGTNSKSVLTSLPNLCGTLTYKITEAYTWSTVTFAADPGSVSIYTPLISNVGVYPAHFEVYLTSYPLVTHISLPFTITI